LQIDKGCFSGFLRFVRSNSFITLLLVPVMYAIFVLDLKWVKWQKITAHEHETNEAAPVPIPVQARVATGSND